MEKRQTISCDPYLDGECTSDTPWNNWGRWVFLVVIFVTFFLLFFFLSCLSARRRRRAGLAPFYGTGWAGQNQYNHGGYYNNGYGNGRNNHNEHNGYYGGGYNQPAPPYQPPPPKYEAGPRDQQPPFGESSAGAFGMQSPAPAHTNGPIEEYPAQPKTSRFNFLNRKR